MATKLDHIIAQKHFEVVALKEKLRQQPEHIIHKVLRGELVPSISCAKTALRSSSLAVIAEIKRASPSLGDIAPILDPMALVQRYISGGANMISVLTDEKFFKGSLEDLNQVAAVATVPVLRKDFIVDTLQIAESVAAGADMVLAIVAVLGQKTKAMVAAAKALGLAVLVEVHNEAELEIALHSGAEVIGVNNRNLSTFAVDPECALRLIENIPSECIRVAESGILNPALARQYAQAGYDAVLIGQALVCAERPDDFIRKCQYG